MNKVIFNAALAMLTVWSLFGGSLVHAEELFKGRDDDEGIRQELHALRAEVASLHAAVSGLEQQNESLQVQLAAVRSNRALLLGPFVSVDPNPEAGVAGPNITFRGANIHIVSGLGAASDNGNPSGLGNLIIGYNEPPGSPGTGTPLNPGDRGGSHNLVVGRFNRFSRSAFGGLVAGEANLISNAAATVTGGNFNAASGADAAVTGGQSNTASGDFGVVTGGQSNIASGAFAAVTGGQSNSANANFTSITGGQGNTAGIEAFSVVTGGYANRAEGFFSVVTGGHANVAQGVVSSITGGDSDSGGTSSICGGASNLTTDGGGTVCGGSGNTGSGFDSIVLGGRTTPPITRPGRSHRNRRSPEWGVAGRVRGEK